ncbi:hypothetical protein CP08DC60_1304B, partial [Chlamydia psittaci 08DC60]
AVLNRLRLVKTGFSRSGLVSAGQNHFVARFQPVWVGLVLFDPVSACLCLSSLVCSGQNRFEPVKTGLSRSGL